MSILSKALNSASIKLLWGFLKGLIEAEAEEPLEQYLADHASYEDLDELEKIVADAREIKAGR